MDFIGKQGTCIAVDSNVQYCLTENNLSMLYSSHCLATLAYS